LGVPWALAFAEEQQMVEMEKEMKMREMGGEVCTSAWILSSRPRYFRTILTFKSAA
jgi:import receptor subunit TOM22